MEFVRGRSCFGAPRILVVEDETLVAMMLEEMLQDLGCVVVAQASRLDRALALARTEDLDAAVLDININEELVYPVAEALQERGIPFLFTTAYGRSELHPDFAGHPILAKPYRSEALAEQLEALLSPRETEE